MNQLDHINRVSLLKELRNDLERYEDDCTQTMNQIYEIEKEYNVDVSGKLFERGYVHLNAYDMLLETNGYEATPVVLSCISDEITKIINTELFEKSLKEELLLAQAIAYDYSEDPFNRWGEKKE